ncbi:hypothetical protein ABVK25_005563 [Lepraria finkii]|uniref:Aminoglycoside phosphotransferase domain-containing protein n=1 Tax=Lepraria finkii TaxID=1340010 RepID=A0ABR4B856_9LECA
MCPDYSSPPKAVGEILRNIHSTIEGDESNANADVRVKDTILLAEGDYNTAWLITYAATEQTPGQNAAVSKAWRFILREPQEGALLPWQIESEIGFLTFITKNHPSIPIPTVYAYDTGESGATPFIAVENIDDKPLSQVWSTYTEEETNAVACDIAKLIVEMAEINFDSIGGLTLAHKFGPIVEGVKLFKGRDKSHLPIQKKP